MSQLPRPPASLPSLSISNRFAPPSAARISFWASDDVFTNEDGSINASAAQGAEGLIGQAPSALAVNTTVGQRMVELWRGASSSNCQGLVYCDSDGDPATWTEYSPVTADAVLLYARAMDALLRRAAPQSETDPDALHAEMLELPVFDGLAGPVKLGPDGDRLGSFRIINFQICSGGGCGRRRLASWIGLDMGATFVEVGSYDSLTENLTVSLLSSSGHARPG